MRIWSLHPQYLDPAGLTAAWREALLARQVLLGRTRGYRHHPQLARFREYPSPVGAINTLLHGIHSESCRRGYSFDSSKIGRTRSTQRIAVTEGQLAFEWEHLCRKLRSRNRAWYRRIAGVEHPRTHPLFRVVPGPVAEWEAA